ncbi:patatin-like phospholipase family protein [Jannaschia formosa]|uniref:patatin-like phospholipase family protein n=1 Tax=Jannaschia formosa TaxID=2259592 RepID=UPI000E1C35D8|nr:patatin-like phospholipase family protein [Jannaschia formosa]TFL16248.1 patatin-like phospholipase family protein [Jannaschia formosa]
MELSLVLGGGNALGAYHLGACEALLGAGWEPGWLIGASIGAVTAAILAGNPPARRLDRLQRFWDSARQPDLAAWWPVPERLRAYYNNSHALAAFMNGRPGLYGPRYPGLYSLFPGMLPDRAIRDHAPLAATLNELIDFDQLNGGGPRVSFISIDIETGEEVWFDSRETRITPRHLLACTALAPLFPPVEIDGRLLCDAGVVNNLPIDRVFRDRPTAGQLSIAVDLFSASHGRPETLDETVARVQDLGFAMQARRSVAALRREMDLLQRLDPERPASILAHLAYRAPGSQRSLKGLDFSERSLCERAAQGAADMESMLHRIARETADDGFVYLGPDPQPHHDREDEVVCRG